MNLFINFRLKLEAIQFQLDRNVTKRAKHFYQLYKSDFFPNITHLECILFINNFHICQNTFLEWHFTFFLLIAPLTILKRISNNSL